MSINDKPLVSILMPTYNRPQYFKEALESALAQTYENIEIIVSDDSDNEETYDLIQEYLGNYECIFYFRNPQISCMAENLIFCTEQAQGEYVQILMDDDLVYPKKIQIMLEAYLNDPNVSLVTSYQDVVNEKSEIIKGHPKFKRKTSVVAGRFAANMFFQHRYPLIAGYPNAPLLRTEDLKQYLIDSKILFAENIIAFYDVGLWMYLWNKGDMLYIAEPLSAYRMHLDQATMILDSERGMWMLHWKLLMNCKKNTQLINSEAEFTQYIYHWLNVSSEIAYNLIRYKGVKAVYEISALTSGSFHDCFKEAFLLLDQK